MQIDISRLSFLLVDDNASFLKLLEILLNDLGAKKIYCATNAQDALELFQQHHPSLCLLDIELTRGRKDGVALAKKMKTLNHEVPVIFLTSYYQQDYYQEAKKIGPSSFMNKELSRLKILQAIELVSMQRGAQFFAKEAKASNSEDKYTGPPPVYFSGKQIFFKVGDAFKPLKIAQIDYFFSENKITYARIEERNFATSVQLKVLEEELAPKFLRCHKKYLVNVDRITSISPRDSKIEVGSDRLNIGYAYRKDFLEKLHTIR